MSIDSELIAEHWTECRWCPRCIGYHWYPLPLDDAFFCATVGEDG